MISRRDFIGGSALALMSPFALQARQSETLYNGITLGRPWPPQWRYADEHPTRPPYLTDRPAIVPVDVGRQLFVDDFLIEQTTLSRTPPPKSIATVSQGSSGQRSVSACRSCSSSGQRESALPMLRRSIGCSS